MAEEFGCRRIGCYPCWHNHSGSTSGLREVRKQLREKSVGVDVAPACKWIAAGRPCEFARRFRRAFGEDEIPPQATIRAVKIGLL
jgi:hypothetical protein